MNTLIGALVGFILIFVIGTYVGSLAYWIYLPPWEWTYEARMLAGIISVLGGAIGAIFGHATAEFR